MFVVLLKFSSNKGQAGQFMAAHRQWIQRGFDDGAFLLAGNLHPSVGGAILVHNTSRSKLEARVNDEPLVGHNIVIAEIIEIAPSRADARLEFLLA